MTRDHVALSIIIPALNEEHRLPETLTEIVSYLQPGNRRVEILVVDDGSTDNTREAALAIPMPDKVRLDVISHSTNRGKGAAIRTGFANAKGAHFLISDADLATPIEELDRLEQAAGPRTVVIGSRAVDRSLIEIRQPWYRDVMGRTFNLIQQALTLPGVVDTQCGFKLFPGDLGRALARVQRLDGFAYDVELLLLARSWGFDILEIGVRWRHVDASRVAPLRHSLQMFRDLVRMGIWRVSRRLPRPPADL